MGEEKRQPELVRICTSGHINPKDEDICLYCTEDISSIMQTVQEDGTSIKNEETLAEEGVPYEAPKEHTASSECINCGAEIESSAKCPRCGQVCKIFRIRWENARLGHTEINGERPVFVGRVPPVDKGLAELIEQHYPTVSRMHAELFIGDQGELYLRDMGSRNGTYINQRTIESFVPEKVGARDKISFSSTLCAVIETVSLDRGNI